jgi:hypothetical protein
MTYQEANNEDLGMVSISLTCDARKGSGICGNSSSITMTDRQQAQRFLYGLGWRLLRGHHVCGLCMRKKRISFPRKKITA